MVSVDLGKLELGAQVDLYGDIVVEIVSPTEDGAWNDHRVEP
jgi:hypothetical protein